MQSIIKFSISLIISIAAGNCLANDSIASVAAGGITFEKTEDIQMTQEELEISTDLIRVNYRFYNKSDKDIHTTVAFPMPPYSFNPGFSTSQENNKPLKSFDAQVNGHIVDIKDDRRAMVGDKDVTKQLRAIGLTDEQIFETFAVCVDYDNTSVGYCGITKAQEAKLEQIGGWTVHETALWEQIFPAHKEVSVMHEYSPLVGGWYYPLDPQDSDSNSWGANTRTSTNDVCVDEGTNKALQRRVRFLVANGADQVTVFVSEVEYILGTGRNWSGSIGDFKLRIIKQSPDQIVSLCFPGKPKRLDAKTLEFTQKNFIPQDKLIINFYTVK